MRLRSILPALLLVALIACGGEDDDAQVASETTTTSAPSEEPVLHVEPDGLLVNEDRFAFGTEGPVAVDALRDVLRMEDEQGDQPECPAGPATFARFGDPDSGLLLTMQDGALAGWSIAEGSTLTTSAGIGIGSTKADVDAAYGSTEVVPDSTLGIELFLENGLSVLLDADAPDGAVTALWAGVNCIFR